MNAGPQTRGRPLPAVALIGDSNTERWCTWIHRAAPPMRWVGTQTWSSSDFHDVHFPGVVRRHGGVFGATAEEIDDVVDTWLAELPVPDIMVVCLGTNDVTDGVAQATTVSKIDSIVAKGEAASPRVRVLVGLPIPRNGQPALEVTNAALGAAIAGQGHETIDLHTAFPSDGFEDQVHVNAKGAMWVAEQICSAVGWA